MGRPLLTKALITPRAGKTDLSGPAGALALESYMRDSSMGKVLPRPDEVFTTGGFSPFRPSNPYPIDRPQPASDMAGPRIWQYPVGWNLPTGPRAMEPVNFEILEQIADRVDIIRIAIETVKKEVGRAKWEITLKDASGTKQDKTYKKKERDELRSFFEMPDPIGGHFYDEWVGQLLEEVLVKDALTIYPRPTLIKGKGILGSSVSALQVIDGKTIKPLLDWSGGRPLPPAPAYQQYLWGVPRSEFTTATDFIEVDEKATVNFTSQQLIYKPFNPRAKTVWGFPPVEWSLVNIITYMRRGLWWQGYFDGSNVPQGFMFGPDGWTPDELERYERSLNAMVAGDPAWQFSIKFVPHGGSYTPVKAPNFDVTFDEFMLKLLLMPFGIPPQELGIGPASRGLGAKGMAEEQKETGDRRSIDPLLSRIQNLNTWIINHYFGQPDLKFHYLDIDIEDKTARASIDKTYVDMGARSRNEIREDNGWESSDEPMANELTITTGQGITPIGQFDPKVVAAQQQADAEAAQANAVQTHEQGLEAQQQSHEQGLQSQQLDHKHDVQIEQIRARNKPKPATKAALEELATFDRFVAKGNRNRAFAFKAVTPEWAEVLNSTLSKRGPVPARVKALQASAAAAITADAQRLADGGDSYGPEDFADDGQATLRNAFLSAFLLGAGAAYRGRGEQWANSAADAQRTFLGGFASDIASGAAPAADIAERSDLYTGGIWAGYQRGVVEDMPDGSSIIWHSEGDDKVCDNCDQLDGQAFEQSALPGFPGDGAFSDPTMCLGGPKCRCWLELVAASNADIAAGVMPDLVKEIGFDQTDAVPSELSFAPIDYGEREKCPDCKGDGCDKCDGRGYLEEES